MICLSVRSTFLFCFNALKKNPFIRVLPWIFQKKKTHLTAASCTMEEERCECDSLFVFSADV